MSNNKQSMKLYTEEQVLKAIHKAMYLGHCNLEDLTPIELPSDEEIVIQSKYIAYKYFEKHHASHCQGLEEGSLRMACWMLNKIQGGNNENKS